MAKIIKTTPINKKVIIFNFSINVPISGEIRRCIPKMINKIPSIPATGL